jgi:hypothetical protein
MPTPSRFINVISGRLMGQPLDSNSTYLHQDTQEHAILTGIPPQMVNAMSVRPEFMLPSVSEETRDRLKLIARAMLQAAHDAAGHPEALIGQFNQQTNRTYNLHDFIVADDTIGFDAFVTHAVLPQPVKVANITDAECLKIIAFLQRGEGTTQEQTYWLEFLNRNLPIQRLST